MEWFLLLVGAGVIVYFIAKRQRADSYGAKTTSEREDQILTMVEHACVQHMQKYPQLPDDAIAQLVRDDLLNHRVKEPEAFRWATAETVGRMRRNIMRAAMANLESPTRAAQRDEPDVERDDDDDDDEVAREPAPKKTVKRRATHGEKREESSGPMVVRLQKCEECGAKNRGDAYACRKCRALLPRARE